MYRRIALSILAAAVLRVGASVPVTSQDRPLAITGASLVDVVNGKVRPNTTVVIGGQTITAVSEGGTPPAGAMLIAARGKFLIPGLWDMHAHIQGSEKGWLALYVANGVTGIRDMGADLDFILDLRSATSSGRILGPRIVAAGPILDDAPGDWPQRIRVRNADEGRAAVRLLKDRGVDLIKVHNFTPRDVFFAIADEARRQNLPLAGHVPLKVTVEEGIEAGLTTIEHLSEDGRVWKACSGGAQYRPEPCRPFFEMLARRGVWQTPTLSALSREDISSEQLVYANKYLRDMWQGNTGWLATRPDIVQILKTQGETARTVTRDMSGLGVGLLAGCDALIAGFCVHDELAMMVRGGMTPLTALQTATINPARYLGRENALGTVAPGKLADLVLLDANPLSDIANVRRIRMVVLSGHPLDRADLDGLLSQARAAAYQ